METTRVLLTGLLPLDADITRGILDAEPDLRVIGQVMSLDGLPTAIRRKRPHVLLVALERREAFDAVIGSLHAFPFLRVVGVRTGPGEVMIEARTVPARGQGYPEHLVAAMRGDVV